MNDHIILEFEPSALVLLSSTTMWHQVFWENREWIYLSLGKTCWCTDISLDKHKKKKEQIIFTRVWLPDGSSLVHCGSLFLSSSHSFIPERSCSWARDAMAGAERDVRRGSGECSLRLSLQPISLGQRWNCWQSWRGTCSQAGPGIKMWQLNKRAQVMRSFQSNLCVRACVSVCPHTAAVA